MEKRDKLANRAAHGVETPSEDLMRKAKVAIFRWEESVRVLEDLAVDLFSIFQKSKETTIINVIE